LSDEQFLKGDASGPTVQLAGELRFPVSNTSPRLPAVIIMHGSGGINPASQSWAYLLNQAGYATFMVDSFSGRGLVQVSTDQAKLGRFAGVLDAFRAYEELARHPRIDPKRIAFIGTSRGGTAVIYTAMRRFQKMWSPAFQGWATFPLYPSCFDRLDQDEDITMPMHAYHGAADDYASKEQCKAWLNRLSGKGLAASNTEYPEAAHSFDNLLADTKPLVSKGAQSTRLCRISEQAGALINTEENKPFSYTDRCVTLDPSTGYNPMATRAMHQSVLEHLARLSKSR
jgi:dienelactone hydrolase